MPARYGNFVSTIIDRSNDRMSILAQLWVSAKIDAGLHRVFILIPSLARAHSKKVQCIQQIRIRIGVDIRRFFGVKEKDGKYGRRMADVAQRTALGTASLLI